MPKPRQMSRRTWVAAWAVLCVVGFVGTAGLNASSVPGLQPEKHVSAECREFIADIKAQLDKARPEVGNDGILAFSRQRPGAEDWQ
ncbi:Secreted protein OS=Streptomyces cyaneofuscatus OX=66883 GN=G3I52_00085 PE=4 SV=1 [Streptomyces cyaneofuscatus]